MLASLYLVIPLTYYLQKQYLILQQAQKKVFLLEEKHGISDSMLEKLIANKITKLMIDIRQPTSDLKQIALFSQKTDVKKNINIKLKQIAQLSDIILNRINDFEEKTTGKKLIK